jgi:CRP-like cAMP-binding protein
MEKQKIEATEVLTLKKDDILCLEGDKKSDLFMIHSGELMVCLLKKSQVIPIAYLGDGEYFGELSFFDQRPRSATVVCTKDATLSKIPVTEIDQQIPKWLQTLARRMSHKIRSLDELISKRGIRKTKSESIKPLSLEEERHYFSLITQAK